MSGPWGGQAENRDGGEATTDAQGGPGGLAEGMKWKTQASED